MRSSELRFEQVSGRFFPELQDVIKTMTRKHVPILFSFCSATAYFVATTRLLCSVTNVWNIWLSLNDRELV